MPISPPIHTVDKNAQKDMRVILEHAIAFHAIRAAVHFNIAGHLQAGPMQVAQLAQITRTNPPFLYRLLRALSSINIFAESTSDAQTFENTEKSSMLIPGIPNSYYASISLLGLAYNTKIWQHIDYSVQTGQPAMDALYHADLWTYLTQIQPADGIIFNQGLQESATLVGASVSLNYDFASYHAIADIGGGLGGMLKLLLHDYPHLQGTLFDLPPTIAEAKKAWSTSSARERCTFISGNFLQNFTLIADLYIFKHVLSNWSDDQCIQILRHCRATMRSTSRILTIEEVVTPDTSHFMDLHFMVVLAGARLRTVKEYQELYEAAGLRINRIIPLTMGISIVEGVSA